MKRFFLAALLLCCAAFQMSAQKSDLVKTGYNFGPLPSVAYDADKGFEVGANLQIFNFGDGSNYPNYDSKLFIEAAWYSKGSQLYQLRYDNKKLIPGVRWSTALRVNLDKAYDFYGFNGYCSYLDYDAIAAGKDKSSDDPLFTPFYRYSRNEMLFKSDFIGDIDQNLKWEAGIFANYFKLGAIDRESINKGKSAQKAYPDLFPTLFELYKAAGVISEAEADGGFAAGLRAGLVYDSRDKEGAPSKGIWAEGHATLAIPGLSEQGYGRYSFTWRHYMPVIDNDVLTFAYRLNYEGTFGNSVPFYALSYLTSMGEKSDCEGMGGFFTVRGLLRTRVIGLDTATYNAELRWRFANFHIGKQNIALGANLFSDGTMATRNLDLGVIGTASQAFKLTNQDKDSLHATMGAGFRFIMNENFIVAVDYGTPFTHFMKNSALYNQDGTGALYINLGYLF